MNNGVQNNILQLKNKHLFNKIYVLIMLGEWKMGSTNGYDGSRVFTVGCQQYLKLKGQEETIQVNYSK